MIATRFSTVGWTGCICAAALSFYLVSQTVAAKRAELVGVDRKIMATQREVGQLETEISTRGGMAQIENWNSRVYGLQAPGAGQFVNSTVQLVAMADPRPLPLDPAITAPRGAVRQASLTVVAPVDAASAGRPVAAPPVAAAADPAPVEQPMIRAATYVQPRKAAMAPDGASVRKVSQVTIEDDDAAKPSVVKSPARPAKSVVKAPAGDDAKHKDKNAARASPRPAMKMTALDDKWLAEVTAEPAGKRSHKGRP